jgi:hypothetical protein
VEMMGFPGRPVTDSRGCYSVTVEFGWAGTVQPVKEGYSFQPDSKIYYQITSNMINENYTANRASTDSGQGEKKDFKDPLITDSFIDEELVVTLDTLSVESGVNIMYPETVQGVITCKLDKIPLSKALEIVLAATPYEAEKKDGYYLITTKKFKISGTVLSDKGKPIEGLTISSDNLGSSVTDSEGRYSFFVEPGWKGTTMLVSEGYIFSPKIRQYPAVTRDQANQNYTAKIQMLTISDTFQFDGNKGVPGINIVANPGNIKTVTDSKGQYSFQVPYGWSGEIKFFKPGITLVPDSKSYKNVTTDIINGIPVQPKTPADFSITKTAPLQPQKSEREGRKILIVPSGNIGPEESAQIREDINVMAEIIDERFREPRLIEGVLRDFGDYFGRDNQQTEAIYIQGYGVIFMMEVNYQFSSRAQPEEKAKPDTNNTDQTWEKARQRVLVPGTSGSETQASAGEYEKQMVNILKTELLRTLKYAANIRNLKPEEWVVLSVTGNGESRTKKYLFSQSNVPNNYIDKISYSEVGQASASIMTMRVKKSDVEEFASGKTDFEQFCEKVQIFIN